MTLLNMILPPHKILSQEHVALHARLCQFKGELLSYFETIETHIGIIILAEKQQNGILDYAQLEQLHLSKSTVTRKITKAIDTVTEAGYYELAHQVAYYRKVLWLRNFFAHSNFYLNDSDQMILTKRTHIDEVIKLIVLDNKLNFETSVVDDSVSQWNGKLLTGIEQELQIQNSIFLPLVQSYTAALGIKQIRYY
jgi:hypothetical protein